MDFCIYIKFMLHMLHELNFVVMYMYGGGPLENIQLCTSMVGSLIEDHLFEEGL